MRNEVTLVPLLNGLFVKHNPGILPKLALLLVLAPGASALAAWLGETRPMMGTEVSVYLWSDDEDAGRRALEAVFVEAERINRLMSTYLDDSEISRVNRLAAQQPVSVGEELFGLIQRSLDVAVLTRGAFDITYDSVGQHYDFRARQRPDADTVTKERENIDYRYVQLDKGAGSVTFLKEGVRINLGGIAKGYAVEKSVDLLRRGYPAPCRDCERDRHCRR